MACAGQRHTAHRLAVDQRTRIKARERRCLPVDLAHVLRRDRQWRGRHGQRTVHITDAVVAGREGPARRVARHDRVRAARHTRRSRLARAGQSHTAHRLAVDQARRGEPVGGKSFAISFDGIGLADGQGLGCDAGPRLVSTCRLGGCCKQIVSGLRKACGVRDDLVCAHIFVIEVGGADCLQSHQRWCCSHIGHQTADSGGGRAVVHLVVAQAKHPSFGIERAATRQFGPISQDFTAGAGVVHRVESDAQFACGDGQAIADTGDGHGTCCCTGTRTVVISTQDHVSCRDRRRSADGHVTPRHRLQVAGGDGGGGIEFDILNGREPKLAGGRRDGCTHGHVSSSSHGQAAIGSCDGLVDVHVACGIQTERGGCSPSDGCIDVDITQTSATCVGCGHRDIAASQSTDQVDHIDVGGADT